MTKKSVLNKSVLKKLVLLSVVSNCLYTGIALAAEETYDSYTLDPIVVTAQRTETRDLETPAATTVLTKEDIKNAFWPKDNNPENKIYSHISTLKSSLKDFPEYQIVTEKGGYRLVISSNE